MPGTAEAPAPNPQPTDVAEPPAAPTVSDSESGESGASWFDALTGRRPAEEPAISDQDDGEPEGVDARAPDAEPQGSEAQPPEPTAPSPSKPPAEPPKAAPGPRDTIRVTREQHDRMVQSEVDRILAKQAKDAQRRAEKEAKLRKAEEDPYGFAEEFRQESQQEQVLEAQITQRNALLTQTMAEASKLAIEQADANLMHPIVGGLSLEDQRKLAEEIKPDGFAGRGRFLKAAVDLLVKQAREAGARDAELRLRKSSAFRKELLAELRGSEDDPELLPAGAVGPAPTSMNDIIRGMWSGRG